MVSPDTFIRTYDATSSYPNDQWTTVAEHVIARLEEFLGAAIRYAPPLQQYIDRGIVMDFACSPRTAGEFAWHIRGILASTVQDKELSFGATILYTALEES